MNDIVERLRDPKRHNDTPLCYEAADEIERLQDDRVDMALKIERLNHEIERLQNERQELQAEIDRLIEQTAAKVIKEVIAPMHAEIERLRAALQAMLDTHGRPQRMEWSNDAAFEHAKQVDAQARRALEARKE